MNAQVDRARTLIELNRPAAARELLATVLAAEPDNAGALAALASAWYQSGDYGQTITSCRSALSALPTYQYAWRLLAFAEFQLSLRAGENRREQSSRRRNAVAAARRAIELGPEDAENLRTLAVVQQFADPREALTLLDDAMELEPENADIHLLRGAILRRQTTRPDALAQADTALRKALELDPENARARYNLALTQLASGRRRAGRDGLRKAAELDPELADEVRAQLAVSTRIGRMRSFIRNYPAAYAAARARRSSVTRSGTRRPTVRLIAAMVVFGIIALSHFLNGSGRDRTPAPVRPDIPTYQPFSTRDRLVPPVLPSDLRFPSLPPPRPTQ
ncbi:MULTISPECIES: tetratricopeptide repeat protein [unclassified Nocardia]|uniref:tetratricopeptide repeat protein n=1 Tax=unclassified Nocardia TaxID=2637762 RepID=UPI001CE47BBE|nr:MULTISPECIES: tetratricopeptide repeat protein [unclassified Nocardia]